MAKKKSRKKQSALTKGEEKLQEKRIAEVILAGRDEKLAARYGIMVDMLAAQLPNEKEMAKEDLQKINSEVDEWKEKATALYKKTDADVKTLGKLFIDIKSFLQHGEFMEWCKRAGFEHNRVNYCMARACPTGDKVEKGRKSRNEKPAMKDRKKFRDYFIALQKAVEKNDVGQAKAMHTSIINMLGLMMDGLKKQATKALAASA